MSVPNSNARNKTIFDDWRQPLATTTEPVGGAKYNAQCVFQQKSNGKIVMKINDGVYDPNAKGPNHREVELNWADRNNLFEGLLEASNNANFKKAQYQVRKKDFIKSGGQSKISDNPITKAQITIERDEKGVVSFTYRKGEYSATIVFRGPNDSIMLMKSPTGETYEERGLMSQWAARSWVKWHQESLNQMEKDRWEPQAPKDGAPQRTNQSPRNNPSNDEFSNDYEEPDF